MTDKEFKRLGRPQLIEIIYQLQLQGEALEAENQKLKAELKSKRIRMEHVGNIAEAALEINNVMQAAQNAAAQYLEEIHRLRTETEEECGRMLEEARKEAAEIVAHGRQHAQDIPTDSIFEAILKELKDLR